MRDRLHLDLIEEKKRKFSAFVCRTVVKTTDSRQDGMMSCRTSGIYSPTELTNA
jgi:hypothetical protein